MEKDFEILPDSEGEVRFGKGAEGKTEELSEGKPIKVLDVVGKKANSGQKKANGKLSALRQYNLGDYL